MSTLLYVFLPKAVHEIIIGSDRNGFEPRLHYLLAVWCQA